MAVKPSKPRSKLIDDGINLKIVIPTKKNYFLIIFLIVWLGGWFLGERFAINEVFYSETANKSINFVSLWLFFWTIGGILAIFTWLWNVFGYEIITITSTSIFRRYELFKFGRTKEFSASHITHLRLSPAPASSFFSNRGIQGWGFLPGQISFDYGAKTYRFAGSVDESEARQILEKIQRRFSHYKSNDAQS